MDMRTQTEGGAGTTKAGFGNSCPRNCETIPVRNGQTASGKNDSSCGHLRLFPACVVVGRKHPQGLTRESHLDCRAAPGQTSWCLARNDQLAPAAGKARCHARKMPKTVSVLKPTSRGAVCSAFSKRTIQIFPLSGQSILSCALLPHWGAIIFLNRVFSIFPNRVFFINRWWRGSPGPQMLADYIIEFGHHPFQVLDKKAAARKPTRDIPKHNNFKSGWRHSISFMLKTLRVNLDI